MDSLMIIPVCGLYQEFYYPTPEFLIYPKKAANNQDLLDANSLFWASILSRETIEETVKLAAVNSVEPEGVPLPFRAAMAEPESFATRVLDAKIRVADQGSTPQRFFSDVETLNIYCSLYAQVNGTCGESFFIQSGLLLKEDSSREVFQKCLATENNPYLCFIHSTVLPIVKAAQPTVVFLSGRPGYFSFALARLIKKCYPSTLICVTRHSSEYYSMNKIDFLLTHNAELFRAIDVVILEHFPQIEKEILNAYTKGLPLHGIKNIIFRSESGAIKHTGYYQISSTAGERPIIQRRLEYRMTSMYVPPDTVINAHLYPYVKCYWNRCNFCGINQKYHFENPVNAYDSIDQQLDELKRTAENAPYVWFIDEALPPETLGKIATYFIQKMPNIVWQARCRIEQDLLTGELPETLARSGLRELRLGLESGSSTVLKRMNKFDNSFSFSLVEEICKRYTACGISIHFPIIIGFPGETDSDRQATYDLLRLLTGKYPLVTFNVNLFGLDIGSKVFQYWYNFDVQSISFPCEPSHYLGNILQWGCASINLKSLMRERDQFMRELLYPWMPTQALTPPHILYRLSETIRDTLIWKAHSLWPDMSDTNILHRKMRTGDLTLIYDNSKDVYYVYSWDSHHYMIGNRCLVDLLQMFRSSSTIESVLEVFSGTAADSYTLDDVSFLIGRLLRDQYLVLGEQYL